MPAYLLLVTICWGLFALLYVLLLKQETFFRANRLYLLLTAVLGLTLPLAGHWFLAVLPTPESLRMDLPILNIGLRQAEQAADLWAVLPYLWWAYFAGAALAAARVLWGVVALCCMAAAGQRQRLPDGALLVRTSRAKLPFSFFRWIFIPVHFEDDSDFEKMLAHEQAHVRGLHSVDVLLAECLCAIFWLHPLAHWYRHSLRTVHEYLADEQASRCTDRRQYGLLLLRQAQPVHALAFANHFFQAPLKQRLLMLARKTSPAIRGWKYGMALPVLVLLVFYIQKNTPAREPIVSEETPVFAPGQIEKQPEYPGGIPALVDYLSKNIQYPAAARQQKMEGIVVVQFVVDETGAVSQAAALQAKQKMSSANPEMAAEAVRIIRQMPRWTPGRSKGRAVRCAMTLPIRFKLE